MSVCSLRASNKELQEFLALLSDTSDDELEASTPEPKAIWYEKFPEVTLTITGSQRVFRELDIHHLTGGKAFYEVSTGKYLEIMHTSIGKRFTETHMPVDYRKEAAEIMGLLSDHPYFQTFVHPLTPIGKDHFTVSEFEFGISLHNIFGIGKGEERYRHLHEQILLNFDYYLAQLITIFETLSDHGVFYGMVKAANLCVLANGKLQLVDLRQAFRPYVQPRKKFHVLPPWVPPEIKDRSVVGPYSHFYSLGGMLYELLTDIPFNVNQEERKYPSDMSRDVIDIVELILTPDYERRIGALSKIKVKPYFRNISWVRLEKGTLDAPLTLPQSYFQL